MLTRVRDARVERAVARGVVLHLHKLTAKKKMDVRVVATCIVQGIAPHTSKEMERTHKPGARMSSMLSLALLRPKCL